MTIKLYDLAGADDAKRFSPYCWRVKMALAHKGLEYKAIPWRFTEKDTIAFSGQGSVPVLVDGERVVADSWRIALYLDEAYPDRPTLVGDEHAKGATLAFKFWCDRALNPAILRVIVLDIFASLHDKDKAYFRETREKRFGMTLEEFGADPEKSIAALRKTLDPVRQVFTEQTYIGGAGPSFADYILFGSFQWPRIVSPKELLAADDPLHAWRERLLDAHGGFARRARAAA